MGVVPVYKAAGAGAATTSTTSIDVPYPAGLAANDLLILHVGAGSSAAAVSTTTPGSWTKITGVDSGSPGDADCYYLRAAGSETGNLTVSGTYDATNGTFGRMYAFSDVITSGTPYEAAGTDTLLATSTVTDVSVTTTGVNRLAVQLVFGRGVAGGAPSQSSFASETGGDWTEALAEYTSTTGRDGSLGLQTASMASAATINGGSFTSSEAVSWIVLGFALIGDPNKYDLNQASETDSAQTHTVVKTADVDIAEETDGAAPIGYYLDDEPFRAEISLNTIYPDAYTDVSSRARVATIRRGRNTNLDRVEAGTADLQLQNGDGAIDPSNTDSTYYPNVLPLRPIRMLRRVDGDPYYRFTGYIERYKPDWVAPRDDALGFTGYQFMNLNCSDAFEQLANQQLLSDQYASLETALTGANNDLEFTAVSPGGDGDAITVTYDDPGAAGASLGSTVTQPYQGGAVTRGNVVFTDYASKFFGSGFRKKRSGGSTGAPVIVNVQGTDIVASLATNGSSVITSTANDILSAFNASADVSKLITTALATGSNGTGVVTAMAKTNLDGGKWAEEASGTRIGRVLDLVGWDADARSIDAGAADVVELGPSPDDNISALQHIQDVADSELGYVFVAANGDFVFHDGSHRSTAERSTTVQAVFSDDGTGFPYHSIDISLDKDRIINEVSVTAGIEDAVAQTASDATSQSTYRRRDINRTTMLTSDAGALTQAEAILDAYADPLTVFESIGLIEDGQSADWASGILNLEIGDVVTVRTSPPGHLTVVEYNCHIEAIEETVSYDRPWEIRFTLTPTTQTVSTPGGGGGGGGGALVDSSGDPFTLGDATAGILA